jgi:hypothetical protein
MGSNKGGAVGETFRGGMPTGPDIARLLETWPTLSAGDEITHARVEEIIGETRASARYRTVLMAFRARLLKERNIDTVAVRGVGLRVLSEAGRVLESANGGRRGVRQIRRSVGRVSLVRTELLPPEERERAAFVRRQLTAVADAGATATRDIAELYKPAPALSVRKP